MSRKRMKDLMDKQEKLIEEKKKKQEQYVSESRSSLYLKEDK